MKLVSWNVNGVRPGEQAVVAQTPWGGLGLTICYDVRFGYLYRALAHAGAAMTLQEGAETDQRGQQRVQAALRNFADQLRDARVDVRLGLAVHGRAGP